MLGREPAEPDNCGDAEKVRDGKLRHRSRRLAQGEKLQKNRRSRPELLEELQRATRRSCLEWLRAEDPQHHNASCRVLSH